jgi:hypothetical protein
MARDPLLILSRLRRLEVAEARRAVAARGAEADAAARQRAAALRALDEEAAAAPADYAAFLPRALAEGEAAAQAVRRAEAGLDVARQGLAVARAAERAVQEVAARRRAATREKAARQAQARLDDWRPREG